MRADEAWFALIAAPAVTLCAATPGYAVQYLSVEQAQRLMFGAGASFERRDVTLSQEMAREIEKNSGVKVSRLQQPWWRVSGQGTAGGHFIVDEVIGKHEFITYAVALGESGAVRQIEILDYRENYGFEVRNPAWRAQFVGKTRADPLSLDADIRNISGATLSCRHISEGVKRLLATYEYLWRPR
jgi:Na+-transporting NADH:ubiquinone oxidoreductase subunit C